MTIHYNHTSSATADSLGQAMDKVKTEAIHTRSTSGAFDNHVSCNDGDGIYIYLSQEEMDEDDTGARAFACISNRNQSEA